MKITALLTAGLFAVVSYSAGAKEAAVPEVLKPYADEVGKWEKDIAGFEAKDRKEDYPADAVLFTGSSSIRLWDTIAEDVAPYAPIQRGFGGSKFSDLAWYADRIIHPHAFQAVVIFVANDVSGKTTDKTPEQVMPLVKHVIASVRSKNATAPVFFIQISPTHSRWKVWDKTTAVNNAIKHHCEGDDLLHYIATEQVILGADGTPRSELFRDDKLHLNRDGYLQWGKIVRTALNGVLKPTR